MSSILIIESGSTKSDWVFKTPNSSIRRAHLSGLNPFSLPPETLEKRIISGFEELGVTEKSAVNIHVFGSGIQQESYPLLQQIFDRIAPSSTLHLDNDLQASGMACYDSQEAGLIGILGTGSNAGYWHKGELIGTTVSLGYVIDDLGGASDIGKELAKIYFKQPSSMPAEIKAILRPLIGEKADFLARIYRSDAEEPANTYLGSLLGACIPKFADHPFVVDLVRGRFQEYLQTNLIQLIRQEREQLRVCGSIGFFFESVLREVCETNNIVLTQVIRRPVEALIDKMQL